MGKFWVLLSCFWVLGCMEEARFVNVRLGVPGGDEVVVRAEVRDDDEGRAKGLMHREKLAENDGMLFVWPESGRRTFWMKNTILPLDMLFIRDNRVVAIIAWTVPFDETTLDPGVESDSVLEVNGGFAQRNGIGVGSLVDW